MHIAIIGAGAGGALLAWGLARQGRGAGLSVTLLERSQHPRFALGEATTPLGNLALRALARDYDLPELLPLTQYGRARAMQSAGHGPIVGPKRGFTFWAAGMAPRPWDPTLRALVAASPDEAKADTSWLRASVDAWLTRRAVAAGAGYHDRVYGLQVERRGAGFSLRWRGGRLRADFVVGASGLDGPLVRSGLLPRSRAVPGMARDCLYTHLHGALPASTLDLPAGPYPDDDAALHLLFPGGWAWWLRPTAAAAAGGSDTVSLGLMLDPRRHPARGPAAVQARDLLQRLAPFAQLTAPARTLRPWTRRRAVARRSARLVAPGLALLPGSAGFLGPMFSTGLPLTLLSVHRLAGLLLASGRARQARGLARYEALLIDESDAVERLLRGAWRQLDAPLDRARFARFVGWSTLYFAAASFAEVRWRLGDGAGPWAPFLRARDTRYQTGIARLAATLDAPAERWFAELHRLIAPIDVAGWCQPRGWLLPVRIDDVIEAAGRLGRTRAEVEAALPLLLD